MAQTHFDVVVIGGGSAGYAAARTLVAGGARTAVIDGAPELGGLCILRGCMPTKALLHAADLRHGFEAAKAWGITAADVRVDLPRLFQRKDELIAEFAGHRRGQLEEGRFQLIRSTAAFRSPHELELADGSVVSAGHFLIATGSCIAPPPLAAMAASGYLTSDDALALVEFPKSIVVLGGGPVAVEFAQFFSRLGVKVTVVQRGPQLLRDCDPDVAAELLKAFRRAGIRVLVGTQLLDAGASQRGKWVRLATSEGECTVSAQEIFHALGRRPRLADLHLDRAGVAVTDGRIVIDAGQRTSVPHIYAAGDCCSPQEIVHLAVLQGEVAAGNILRPDRPRTMDYRLLLSVVFTEPQVAQVGLTEKKARLDGLEILSARYPFNDHGKSMILASDDGFVKLIAGRSSGEILGAACVGPQGGELIHEMMVAMAARMTVGQFAVLPHYHPTLAEIWTYPAEELAARIAPADSGAASALPARGH